jgi:hypothetical protein
MTPPGATPVASITINALDPGRPVRHAGITETACDHRHRRTREREDTPERDHVGDAATRGDGRHALRGRSTGSSTRLSVRADDQIIEVLAPDGLGRAARTAGKLETIQIRGGTQALERNEVHPHATKATVAAKHRDHTRARRPRVACALLARTPQSRPRRVPDPGGLTSKGHASTFAV